MAEVIIRPVDSQDPGATLAREGIRSLVQLRAETMRFAAFAASCAACRRH